MDQLQHQIDELARQTYTTGDHSAAALDRLNELKDQLAGAKTHLGELNAVHDALGKAPETYLTAFDPRTATGKQVLAAVAVGNPDTARNVSVTVPGIGSTTKDTLPGMVSEAQNLRLEAERQLRNAGLPGFGSDNRLDGLRPSAQPVEHAQSRGCIGHHG